MKLLIYIDEHMLKIAKITRIIRKKYVERPDLVIINKINKRTWCIADFVVPADNIRKFKERNKGHKYSDLARELIKLRKKMTTLVGEDLRVLLPLRPQWKIIS